MKFDLDNEKIFMTKKNGETIECDVLFTFDCEETMKSYVGYTDNIIAKNGRKNIFVSSYDPLSPTAELKDITDDAELRMVNDVLEKLDEDCR